MGNNQKSDGKHLRTEKDAAKDFEEKKKLANLLKQDLLEKTITEYCKAMAGKKPLAPILKSATEEMRSVFEGGPVDESICHGYREMLDRVIMALPINPPATADEISLLCRLDEMGLLTCSFCCLKFKLTCSCPLYFGTGIDLQSDLQNLTSSREIVHPCTKQAFISRKVSRSMKKNQNKITQLLQTAKIVKVD